MDVSNLSRAMSGLSQPNNTGGGIYSLLKVPNEKKTKLKYSKGWQVFKRKLHYKVTKSLELSFSHRPNTSHSNFLRLS